MANDVSRKMSKMECNPQQLAAFRSAFGTERQCRRFLFRQKWPRGFECPKCHHRGAMEREGGLRWVCRRRGCSYWESPTVGTIAESIKKPLRLWFWGLWLYIHAHGGMTASRLQAELELGSYQTAWTWCHKFRAAIQSHSDWVSTFESLNARLPENREALNSFGIHGWRGGRKGWLTGLFAPLPPSPQLSAFHVWLLRLNVGRSSAKHCRAYWAEHRFWESNPSAKRRWTEMSNLLGSSSVPYWRLVRRKAPKIALVSRTGGRAAPLAGQNHGGAS